jgi:hypothetical protein
MKLRYIFLILALIILSACSSTEDITASYDIVGTIESINHSQSGNITGCLVKASDSSSTYDQAHIRIIGDTDIYQEGSEDPVEPGLLTEKMLIGVVFKGAIAESYPIQVNAGEIVILD